MYYIGVDLGGTNIAVGLLDENFKIVAKEKCPTKTERDISEIMDDMGKLCNTLMEKNNLTASDIAYIGIATPGSVIPPKGMVAYSNNVKMENYPISAELAARTGVTKVYVENDANAAALGEAIMGAGKGSENVIMITLGTGVGGGIVINRKLYSGFNFAGGELGHTVIKTDGRACSCGRKGCWEAYGSATALIRQTKAAIEANPDSELAKLVDGDVSKVNGKTAFDAMRAGCPVGTAVVEKYVEYFSTGITNIINIFQPEKLVIGGGVSKEGKTLTDMIMKYVSAERYGEGTGLPLTTLCTAVLGNDAGIIGAAALGI